MPTSKVKTLSAHLKGQNPKCPPQRSKPEVPTLKVKTQIPQLKGQNPKCQAQISKPEALKGQYQSACQNVPGKKRPRPMCSAKK